MDDFIISPNFKLKSKSRISDLKPIYTDGVIAFQLHSGGEGKMRFKDIWIWDLTPR